MTVPRIHSHPRVAFVCGVVLLALVAGCSKRDEKPAARTPDPVEVRLTAVRFESIPRTVDVVGTLYGDEEATLSAKVPGRILDILMDVGDRASPGDVIAQIDPTDYKLVVAQREMDVREALAKLGLDEMPDDSFDASTVATVQRARLQADNAQAKLERGEKLFRQQPPLISEQDFADLETAFAVARRDYEVALLEASALLATARARQSELAAARQRLADASIRAPGGGTASASTAPSQQRWAIAKRLVSVGEYVREGDPLFQIVADDPLKLRAAVPERYINEIRIGQKVTLRLEGVSGPVVGRVSRVSPSVDVASRTFQIEALIPNPDRQLRPGAFARAAVEVGVDEKVPFVPRDAVVSFAGLHKVYSVNDGKAVEHRCTLGSVRDDGYIALTSGFRDADHVVIEGQSKLAADVPVIVAATQPATAPASDAVE
jgi:membrane fusion protein (multidrug efflux system)